jgi:drug/metabolite transporter (DMT)-like permease
MLNTHTLFMFLAAALWGVTNPLLKKYTAGMEGASSKEQGNGFLVDIKFLLRRPKYLVTQGLNLLGSVAFFAALRGVDISTGSVVTNSLATAITLVVSVFVMKEGGMEPRTYAGIALVLTGVSICTLAK